MPINILLNGLFVILMFFIDSIQGRTSALEIGGAPKLELTYLGLYFIFASTDDSNR
jgi:hypothetical protein